MNSSSFLAAASVFLLVGAPPPLPAQSAGEKLPAATRPPEGHEAIDPGKVADPRPPTKDDLLSHLRSRGEPATPEEVRRRGKTKRLPAATRPPEGSTSQGESRRAEREARRTPPSRAELLRHIAGSPEGRAKLEDARRRGAPVDRALRSESDGPREPQSFAYRLAGERFIPSTAPLASLASPGSGPTLRSSSPPETSAYSLTLKTYNHFSSSPYGRLNFTNVGLDGQVVWLTGGGSFRACTKVHTKLPADGWYMLNMEAYQKGSLKPKVELLAGGHYLWKVHEWDFTQSSNSLYKFATILEFSRGDQYIWWCATEGSVFFLQVNLYSL